MKKVFLILTIFVIGSAANAQQVALTFEEAVKIGLNQNVELAKASNNLSASMAWRQSAMASMLPTINASAFAYVNDGNFFIEQEARVVNSVSQNANASIDARLSLFTGLSRFNELKQANHTFNAQQANLRRSKQTVLFWIAGQYLTVLQDQEMLGIAEENLSSQKQLSDQISEFVNAGSRARLDLLNQEATMKASELDVVRGRLNLRNSKAILANTLRLDPGAEFAVDDPAWNVESLSFDNYPTLDAMYEIALSNRADLLSSKEKEQADARAIAVAKGSFAPSLSAFFGYSSRYTDQTVRVFSDQFFIDNTRQQYGLSLNVPIFNGLRNRAQFVQSKITSENSSLDREYLQLSVKSDVLREYQNYLDMKAAFETSKSAFEAADLAHTSQRESHILGLGTQIEVSTAYSNLVRAQTDMANLEYALLFQKIMLDYALGTLTTEDF